MKNRMLCLLLCLFLAACNLPASSEEVSVWIDVPVSGLTILLGQQVHIEGHAASQMGIGRVEVSLNGAPLDNIDAPPMTGALAYFAVAWTPSEPGEYTVEAIAFTSEGTASQPDSTLVIVVPPATPSSTPVPTYTPTPTSTSPPGAVIQFWAEPAQIEAGVCTTLYWHVENAQRVIFGGVEQSLDGSYRDCPCDDQLYSLRVTHLDGSEETKQVTVKVNGSCVTPTLPDTTPPPAPTLVVPANGLTLTCRGSQSLTWLPVTDPSGIASYEVQVQRHGGDNNWQDVPGSIFTVTNKTMTLPVECGWYYRWRVRAVDGAGNIGDWSGWSLFTVELI